MKTNLFLFILCLLSSMGWSQKTDNSCHIQINGYLGTRIDECITGRILAQDIDHIIEPFRNKTETHRWQSEFWGKWMLGACDAYSYNQDKLLFEKIRYAVDELLKTQSPDGYIGNYAPEAQLAEWDVWGRKYSLLGLQAWYRISGDKRALAACCKMADHLMSQIGPRGADIAQTGNYRGLAAGSILEPIVLLYRNTGEKKYLDFALYIVERWESDKGPQLISRALENKPVAGRFLPIPPANQWTLNGHKAYEMMSCYIGLLDLYKITHEPSYLAAAETTARQIIEEEITIAGSASATECFWHGQKQQTTPAFVSNETCVTYTWMQLCDRLYRITGNSVYIDQLEKTAYNALQAAMRKGGTHIASYVPLEGFRRIGERQCGLNINCCEANGPRGFTLLPQMMAMTKGNRIDINLYGEMKGTFRLENKNEVDIEQKTAYPVENIIEIRIDPHKESVFTLALRIPLWSKKNRLYVNGMEQSGSITTGSYFTLTRKWKKGDVVTLQLDLQGKLVTLNNYVALVRGPVVLARDSRFNDGFVDETIAIEYHGDKSVTLHPVTNKSDFAWMEFSVNCLTSIYSGDKESFRTVRFCDFGSAGNTWDEQQRYRVWLPYTIEVADRNTWW